MTKNKKRLLVELALALLLFASGVVYVYKTNLRAELQLLIRVNVSHLQEETFQLFIGKDLSIEARTKPAKLTREVTFPLPQTRIRDLRINLGQTPGLIALQSLTIKSPFKIIDKLIL